MAEYHFVTTYKFEAPIERVWQTVRALDHYPSWAKGIFHAQHLESGTADGAGERVRHKVKGRLPYTLILDFTVSQADPPRFLELRAVGELEGVGRWTLSQHEATTTAEYTWDVRTTKRWMNLLAPLARPIFEWNHDSVMRDAGQGLARLLGARLVSIEVGSRRNSPTPA